MRRAISFLAATHQGPEAAKDLATHLGVSAAHLERTLLGWCGLSSTDFAQALRREHILCRLTRPVFGGEAAYRGAVHAFEVRITAKEHSLFGEKERGRALGIKIGDEWGYVRLTAIVSEHEVHARILNGFEKGGVSDVWIEGMVPWIFHDLRRSMTTKLNELRVAEKVADIIINHRAKKKGGVAAVYNRYQYMTERKAAIELWCRHFDDLLNGNSAALNVIAMPISA